MKRSVGPSGGGLDRGRAVGIAHQAVGQPHGPGIRRPRPGHAEGGGGPSPSVLDQTQQAGLDHLGEGRPPVAQQRTGNLRRSPLPPGSGAGPRPPRRSTRRLRPGGGRRAVAPGRTRGGRSDPGSATRPGWPGGRPRRTRRPAPPSRRAPRAGVWDAGGPTPGRGEADQVREARGEAQEGHGQVHATQGVHDGPGSDAETRGHRPEVGAVEGHRDHDPPPAGAVPVPVGRRTGDPRGQGGEPGLDPVEGSRPRVEMDDEVPEPHHPLLHSGRRASTRPVRTRRGRPAGGRRRRRPPRPAAPRPRRGSTLAVTAVDRPVRPAPRP